MINRNTAETWLALAKTGDILIFCDGNPDRLANKNADFKEAYEILKQAHADRQAYLDVNQQGQCVARKGGDEFTQDALSNIVHGKRETIATPHNPEEADNA